MYVCADPRLLNGVAVTENRPACRTTRIPSPSNWRMRRVKQVASGRDLHEAALPGRRALLVDQHPLWHEAVELVLRRLEVEVVGRFVDPDEALAVLEDEAPPTCSSST